jgi:molybdopterin molybdotransferase
LVDVSELPLSFQIRNSNSYSLGAQLLAAGAEPLLLSPARDNEKHLAAGIRRGLESELLLLSGGVSMGKYDLVEQVLLEMGADFYFTGALIQPGKPVVFGGLEWEGRLAYFFGLPGNPVSTMVTFSLFVEPFLRVLAGEPFSGPRFAKAKLSQAYQGKPGLTRFLPALLKSDLESGIPEPTVERIPWQGSGDMAATSRSNCFLMVPADCTALTAGDEVTVLL